MSQAKRAIAGGARKPAKQPIQVGDKIPDMPAHEPADGIAKGKRGFTFRSVMLEAVIAQAALVVGKREGTAVSQHMLILAQQSDTVDSFIKATKDAEDYIKAADGKADAMRALDDTDLNLTANDTAAVVGVVPGQWRQYRNNIKKAWEAGILPYEYKTENALRNALNAHRNKVNGKDTLLVAVHGVQANLAAILKAYRKKPIKERAALAKIISTDGEKFAKLAKSLVPVAPVKGKGKGKTAPVREAGATA